MPDNELRRAHEPFRFTTQVHFRELTGRKARNLRELLEHIRTVPGSVIYHHTHHFLEQHQFLSPEPTNDFAYWVNEVLNEKELGEKLLSINTCEFSTIRSLRDTIASAIENFLAKSKRALKEARLGEEFHFVKSVSFILPTPYVAFTLEEFVAGLRKVTIHSLYFHMFEARLRLERESNDFSAWLKGALGEKELADRIARLDPYTHTMEGLRQKIISLVETKTKRDQTREVPGLRPGT